MKFNSTGVGGPSKVKLVRLGKLPKNRLPVDYNIFELDITNEDVVTSSLRTLGLDKYKWYYRSDSKTRCCESSMVELAGYTNSKDKYRRDRDILVCGTCGKIVAGGIEFLGRLNNA